MPPTPRETHEVDPALERIIFFSDAVIAIAITLLVLDLRLPETASDRPLGQVLAGMVPKFMGFLVSFWVIALYWLAHHRCYRYIHSYNRRLIMLNFLFLMTIAFMPFPTGVLFSHRLETASVVLYALTAALMGLSLAGLWQYAVRHHMVLRTLSDEMIVSIRTNLLLPTAIFIATAVLALVNPALAMLGWLALIPVYAYRRISDRRLFHGNE